MKVRSRPDATGPCKGERGPYFQSQRKANYLARVEALLSRGLAYEHEGAIKFKMTREPITFRPRVGDVVASAHRPRTAGPGLGAGAFRRQPVFTSVNVVDDLEMASRT